MIIPRILLKKWLSLSSWQQKIKEKLLCGKGLNSNPCRSNRKFSLSLTEISTSKDRTCKIDKILGIGFIMMLTDLFHDFDTKWPPLFMRPRTYNQPDALSRLQPCKSIERKKMLWPCVCILVPCPLAQCTVLAPKEFHPLPLTRWHLIDPWTSQPTNKENLSSYAIHHVYS